MVQSTAAGLAGSSKGVNFSTGDEEGSSPPRVGAGTGEVVHGVSDAQRSSATASAALPFKISSVGGGASGSASTGVVAGAGWEAEVRLAAMMAAVVFADEKFVKDVMFMAIVQIPTDRQEGSEETWPRGRAV